MKKEKKQQASDLGKPIFNLTIKTRVVDRKFEPAKYFSAEEQIRLCGMAINRANFMLGKMHVTEKGYLVHDHLYKLPHVAAVIIIDENITELQILEKVSKGEIKDTPSTPCVHLHYNDHVPDDIKCDTDGIYLAKVRKSFESGQINQRITQMLSA